MKRRRILRSCVALAAIGLLADAGYIEAKAWLAQALLARAWTHVELGEANAKPWPWADTTPVAKLTVERLGIERIVLRGDSGRNLAFGPAWNEASALPGEHGTSVISGHRDTHFYFLNLLKIGDEIVIERAGISHHYRIDASRIVDTNTARLVLTNDDNALLLVTCYPFDALMPGGALRYVVEARHTGIRMGL